MWHGILVRELARRLGPPEEARHRPVDPEKVLTGLKEDEQVSFPIAYAYATDFPENPWRRHPAALDALRVVARRQFQSQKDIGRRVTWPLLTAFRLVRNDLGAEAAEWKRELVRIFRAQVLPHLRKRERLAVFSSANVGYGTNHLAVEVSGMTAYVRAFRDDADWASLDPGGPGFEDYARDYLARFMDYMNPGGYWVECDGPANSYNSLSASALLRAADDLGQVETYRHHFEAVSRFSALTTLPNLRSHDLTDGRNKLRKQVSVRKCFAGFTPEGQAIREQAMDRMVRDSLDGQPFAGQELNEALCNIVMQRHDAKGAAVCIWDRGDFTDSFRDGFTFLRLGPWIAAASTILFRPRPEGHWNLDYQNLFSLYHDRFGIAVHGANGKNDPELATFHKFFDAADGMVVRNPEALRSYIPGAGRISVRDDGFKLMREYRGFEGFIELTVKNERETEVRAAVNAREDAYPVWFTIQPPLFFGQTFRDGHGQEHTVREDAFALNGKDLGGKLIFQPEEQPHLRKKDPPQPLTLTVPGEAELLWPYQSWDAYNLKTDRYTAPADWTVRLRVPVGPEGVTLAFRVG